MVKDSLAAAQILIKKKKSFSSLTSIKKNYAHDTQKKKLCIEWKGWSRHKRSVKLRGKLKIRWEGNDIQKKIRKLIFLTTFKALKFNWFDSVYEKEENEMFKMIVINENENSSGWSWSGDKIKVQIYFFRAIKVLLKIKISEIDYNPSVKAPDFC